MNVAIVEDEDDAAEQLRFCLNRYAEEEGCIFDITRYRNAIPFIENYRPVYDLVFMDIRMPYMDGMQAAEKLRETDKTVNLIFVTNLTQYAVQGYKVEALDYIIKPIDYYALKLTLMRALQRLRERDRSKTVLVSVAGKKTRLSADSILYVEVMGHTLTYHTFAGEFQSYGSLSEVKKQLTHEDGFSSPNSCYLVNLRYVKQIDGDDVHVGNDVLKASYHNLKVV